MPGKGAYSGELGYSVLLLVRNQIQCYSVKSKVIGVRTSLAGCAAHLGQELSLADGQLVQRNKEKTDMTDDTKLNPPPD